MSRYKALSDRLRREEARRGQRARRRAIFSIYGRTDADLIGYRGARGPTIEREPGERYERFRSRALAVLREPIIMAVYGDRKVDDAEFV